MEAVEGGTQPGGLEGLFALHRDELLRFLTARCGNPEEAEDHLQDLWIKVSTQQAAGPIANGRAYLYRMANNLVLDQVRGRHRAMRRYRDWLEQDGGEGHDTQTAGGETGPARR